MVQLGMLPMKEGPRPVKTFLIRHMCMFSKIPLVISLMIQERKISQLLYISTWYFYPYNDWWNKHEGDWQLVNVVVTGVVVGVEYLFHGAHLTYYDDEFLRNLGYNIQRPQVNNAFTHNPKFNPREEIRLSGLSRPIVYVGVGSHAAYPTGGTYELVAGGTVLGEDALPNALLERMSHTGLVLSTQADNSHSGLWENYELVLLPGPNSTDTNNMDLPSNMSWLGADVRWGDLSVDSATIFDFGSESPEGPYHKDEWKTLRFLSQSLLHKKEALPRDHTIIPYDSDNKFYHSFIFSDEIWNSASGNIELDGDIVIFPGATLTIAPGTNIRFDRNTDTKKHDLGRDDRAEIFVYGTLKTNGTPEDPVVFGGAFQSNREELWGGIREVEGGQALLTHTKIRNAPPAKPRILTVEPGNKTATITWDNGGDPSVGLYQTRMKTESASTWPDWGEALTSHTTYTKTNLTNGVSYLFSVRAINQFSSHPDGDEWVNSDSLVVKVTPAGPPEPPELTVAAGHERVRMSWSPGADNSSPIEQHEWRYKAGAAAWDPDWTVYATREQIIRNLDNDTTYTFQMKAKNKVGYSEVVAVQATPRHPIEGPTAVSFAENSDDPVASYRFAPAELDQSLVDYNLRLSDIADSGLFELDSQGRLSFRAAPDFETPTDADGDHVYTVWLKAAPVSGNGEPTPQSKPPLPFTKQVEVTVTDADDPGVIVLSPLPPQVGVSFTAELTDQDGGITGANWQWQRWSRPTASWISASGTSSQPQAWVSTYTPQAGDVGDSLRATVRYTDAEGPNQRAQSTATEAVQVAPTIHLTGSRGDGQVGLRWTAPANSATIAGYQVRRRLSDSAQDWPLVGRRCRAAPRRAVHDGYGADQWENLSVSSAGSRQRGHFGRRVQRRVGDTSRGAGLRHRILCPFQAMVRCCWSGKPPPTTARRLARYEIQSRQVSDPAQPWSRLGRGVGGAQCARYDGDGADQWAGLHEFAVRAVNGVGDGASIAQVAMPQALSLTASGGDGQVALNWTSSAHSSTIAHYQVRQRISDSGQDWSDWATVPGGTSARDTTVTGLTNGKTYQFQAQAIDSQDALISVSNVVSATPQKPSPGPVRNLSAEGGSASGRIAVSWDAPNTGGTPDLYRVEYRQGSAAWQAGGTTIQTRLSIGDLVGGSNYSIQVRAENGGGHSRWRSTTATATGTETAYAYRLHDSGTTAPSFTASASSVPTGWSSSRQTPTSSHRYEWRISRTRPTGGSWSNWGSAVVVVEAEYAYRVGNSGSTVPSFSASSSGIPTGWSSSRRTPGPSVPYEWRISRTRPTGGSWSNWGSATVASTYTERQYAYRVGNSGSTVPSFSASSSGIPTGWSSSWQTPTSSNPYMWRISRTRPTDGSWSNWDSATVVSTYTERQYAYRVGNSGSTVPSFSASASGIPTGWSSSRRTPGPSVPYEWEIRRTRPTGGSWSSWGSATVVSKYTERQSAYKRNDSGTSAPTFSASASGVPSGWSSSRQTPTSSNRYEWKISRTRPAGESWSSWGSATVVSKYTERQYAYRVGNSGSNAPSFSASSSGLPTGWSSSRQTPGPSVPYEWEISRTRPTGGSWSSWGSATVVSKYTERQSAYKRNDSGTIGPGVQQRRPVGCPPAGRRRSRRATSSNRYVWKHQLARGRPASRGPVGAAPPSCLPTPSGSMPTGSVIPAARPLRLAPPPAGFPPAGRRRGGRLVRRCPTSGDQSHAAGGRVVVQLG